MDTLLQYGLVAVLVALFLAPFGLPIPEDISLLAAGVLARTGHATYTNALIVGYIGVVGGDIIVWNLGRKVGLHPTGWLGRLFGQRQTQRITRFYRRFGPWTVVICRNLPGMRFPAFFFSGATGMSFRRFLLLDGTAAVITTVVWTRIGWWIGPRLRESMGLLSDIRWGLMGLGIVLASVVIWRFFLRPPPLPPEDSGEEG
ncbi:MAG: DedA family protein [Alphaproteobacteria bacterium]|nr:DedA family protein [Alphaproteobacteria bacterium]